jgi:hypothetical protein
MKRFVLELSALALLACTAAAQTLELHGGYNVQHMTPANGASLNFSGWTAGAQYNFTHYAKLPNLALAADFSGSYGKQSGVTLNHYVYLAGPRLTEDFGRVRIFEHVLIGNAQLTAKLGSMSDSTSSLAIAPGGGFDVKLSRRWSLCPAQFDWLVTNHGHNAQNSFRYSTGVVWKF